MQYAGEANPTPNQHVHRRHTLMNNPGLTRLIHERVMMMGMRVPN